MAGVFVDFPKNKCNFLHKTSLISYTAGPIPYRAAFYEEFFSPAAVATIAYGSRQWQNRVLVAYAYVSDQVCVHLNSWCILNIYVVTCNQLNRFTARRYAIARYMLWPCVRLCLSVCLSVSVTSRCCTKTAKYRITQTKPHDRPGTHSFLVPKILGKFHRGSPPARAWQIGK